MSLSEELKIKMIDAVRNNKIVGYARFTEEEYQEMLNFTRWSVLRNNTDELNFVALVEIAKRWRKNDGGESDESGFWDFVFDELEFSYDQQRYLKYTNMIDRLGRQRKIIAAKTAKKYYATLMMHSFSPQKSVYAFLDLIYNVYKNDLDFNYTEADEVICELIYDSFRELILKMRSGEDVVSIGSTSYNVKIGLRCLALGTDSRDVFFELVNSALLHIHSLYHKRDIFPDNYFEEILCEWWISKAKEVGLPKLKHGIEPAVTKNTITVKFVRIDDKVILRIPPIRMNNKDQSSLFVSIYSGDEVCPNFCEELKTKKGELILTSLQLDINLNELSLSNDLINFRIEIYTPNEVLFSKKFDVEFILFGDKTEVSSTVVKPDNYFLYARSLENLLIPENISTYAKNLYNIYPHDGEMLSGHKKSTLFINALEDCKTEKVSLFGKLRNCSWETNSDTYEIFTGNINLLVANFSSINGLELYINGFGILLSQLEFELDAEQKVYNIGPLLSENIPYDIYLYSHTLQKELLKVKLVNFKDFNFKFSCDLFYGDDVKSLTILDKGIARHVTWDNNQNQIETAIRGGKLTIVIPYLKWRIDNTGWHNEPIQKLSWYKDLVHSGSLLEICYPSENADVQVYAFVDNQVAEVNKNANGKHEIGRSIYSNENRSCINYGIKVQKTLKTFHLFDISTREYFFGEPLSVHGNNVIFCSLNFVGERDKIFKITLAKIGQNPICVSSDDLSDGIIPNISEGIYWATISSQLGGLFTKKEMIFWEGEFVFGDKDKLQLSNMLYKISPLNGQGLSDSWKKMRSGYYVTNLVRLEGNPNMYTAKLFYLSADKNRRELENIDICQIEILSSIAMSILVKDEEGKFIKKLMCDRSGNLNFVNSENRFPITITNYNFIEVKNV